MVDLSLRHSACEIVERLERAWATDGAQAAPRAALIVAALADAGLLVGIKREDGANTYTVTSADGWLQRNGHVSIPQNPGHGFGFVPQMPLHYSRDGS